MISDDAIHDAPGLLGVDAIHIDRVRVAEGAGDLVLGDGGELDALGLRGWHAELFGEVPGNGLTFAIQDGCEPDLGRLFGGPLEIVDGLLFAFENLIRGGEVVLEINSRNGPLDTLWVLLGKIADVADGGEHEEVVA